MNENLFAPAVELSILGSILLENNSIDAAIEIIKPECFYEERNKRIYTLMLRMNEFCIPIDTVSLYQQIKKENLTDKIDNKFISKLSNFISSSANIKHHCKILYELWIKRETLSYIKTTEKKILSGDDIFDIHSNLLENLDSLNDDFTLINQRDKNLWEEFAESLYKIEDRITRGDSGLRSTTFPSFNKITGGIRETDLVCVFGKYKSGKSTFSLQLALDLAIHEKVPVGIFSLEMDKDSLYNKSFSMRTGIDYLKLRSPKENNLTSEELRKLQNEGIKIFKDTKIYISDQTFNKNRIKAKMKLWKKMFGIKFFVVDYLNLIESPKAERRDLQIGELSRFFKLAAKELQVPILMLTQANNDGKTAESSALLRDADFVFFVSKPREEGITSEQGYYYTEDDFTIQLKYSRHGRNGYYFVARFIDNNFVEIDIKSNFSQEANRSINYANEEII